MPKSTIQLKALARKATGLGALQAKLIPTSQVFTAAWVRLKCQYGCGSYGQSLTCPPHSPTPEQTRSVLDSYQTALLLHGRDGRKLKQITVALEREAFLSGFYKAFAMGNGPCYLCPQCELKSGECRHPEQARPAMEACGIDVFKTARAASFPIEVLSRTDQTGDFYSLVLLE